MDLGLDDEEDPLPCFHGFLTLISRDNTNHVVSRGNANLSRLLQVATGNDPQETTISLGEVDGPILDYVIEYMDHHLGQLPLRSGEGEGTSSFTTWDQLFINRMEQDSLYELVCAASYLDMDSLLHLACAKIADYIRKQEPLENLRKHCNL
jgi:S-phase kinase-associated protein 1